MLIALFTAMFLLYWSSSSAPLMANLEQAEKLIKANVADDAQREQALKIVGRMKDVTKAYHSRNENVAKSLSNLVKSRTTQPAALEATLEPLLADDNATREQLVDLRFQLQSVLTAKEWAAVFPPPKAAPAAGAQKNAAAPRIESSLLPATCDCAGFGEPQLVIPGRRKGGTRGDAENTCEGARLRQGKSWSTVGVASRSAATTLQLTYR
jgi:hypothetical protein